MTKGELVKAMKDYPDDMEVVTSSEKLFDTYEIKSVRDDNDGVIHLEID